MCYFNEEEKEAFVDNLRKRREQVFPGRGGNGRLAKAAGVAPQLLSQWLKGKRAPSSGQVYALAKALGVDARKARGRRKAKAGAPGNDLPEIVKGQIDAIDTLIFILRYNKLALLSGESGRRYRGGIRILRQLVEQELRDKEVANCS